MNFYLFIWIAVTKPTGTNNSNFTRHIARTGAANVQTKLFEKDTQQLQGKEYIINNKKFNSTGLYLFSGMNCRLKFGTVRCNYF